VAAPDFAPPLRSGRRRLRDNRSPAASGRRYRVSDLAVILNSTEITGTGLVHLKGMANLKILSLRFSEVTDAGLVYLKGLTQRKNRRPAPKRDHRATPLLEKKRRQTS